ncbi:hypothetical protein AB4S83_004296 [Vibrio vulnificus]
MFELCSTKKQHFLSVAEQRLNAIDPTKNRKKLKIYQHEIFNKSDIEISLTNDNGVYCEKNLMDYDVFSFHIDGKYRYNFERYFRKYENVVGHLSACISTAYNVRSDIEKDIQDLLACKFFNIIRCPYNIKFVNKYFSSLLDAPLKDELCRYYYGKIESSDLGSINRLSSEYGVTPIEYKTWLSKILVFLAIPYYNGNCYLDLYVDKLFNSKYNLVNFDVKRYSEPCVLLPDRAYVDNSHDGYFMMSFNVSSYVYVNVSFLNVLNVVQKYKESGKNINASYSEIISYFNGRKRYKSSPMDDLNSLRGFNRACVLRSKRHVYSSFCDVKYL